MLPEAEIIELDINPLIVDEDEPLTIGLENLLVEDPDDVYPDDFTLTIEPGDNYTVTAVDTITSQSTKAIRL